MDELDEERAGRPAAYDVDFDWDESHGRLVSLLSGRSARGVVIDLGCGYAPHAEAMAAAGFTYVGLDINDVAVEAVAARGFDAHHLDLGDLEATMRTLRGVAESSTEPVAAVLAIDVIEHLVEPQRLLGELSVWLDQHADAALGVSVPNVAHRDVGAKLLAGRWDVTPTGLLDHTHLRFFTDASLHELMTSAAFVEVARLDRSAERTDQSWPAGLPTIDASSRSGAWLDALRSRADRHGTTYQFIRLFEPTGDAPSGAPLGSAAPAAPSVFLSVLAEPLMSADEVDHLRTMLEGQSTRSWELVCAADVGPRPSRVETLAAMIDGAVGHHLSVVAPGDSLTANWVEQFAQAAATESGSLLATILRCDQSADADAGPVAHASIEELGTVGAPSAAFALPTEAVRGVDLDNEKSPTATLLLDAVEFCGITQTGVVGVDGAHSALLDHATVDAWVVACDTRPALMPAGVRRRIGDLELARMQAEQRAEELSAAVEALQRDNRWLNAELAVTPVRALRRLLRRGRSAH